VLLRVPRVQEHLRCHQLRRTSPILGLGYGARERRDNPLACNAIPQKRDLQSHSFTNLTAESRRHIYKKPDFSRTDSMRNNRLVALCNRLYITTGWIVLDVCRLEDCQPERRLPTRRPMPSGPCLRRPLKKEEVGGSPDDFRPQTQLVLTRKQLYNRCK
jgi:hypothetical protein